MAATVRRPFIATAMAVLAACLLALLAAPGARAGYPGQLGSIAITSTSGDSTDEIFTIPNTGGPPFMQLTFDAFGNVHEDDNDPAYSGDGKRIVWESQGANDEIAIMNADGSGQTQLTPSSDTGRDENPAISWDGKRIVFECEDPDNEICVMNADGTGRTQLTNNTTSDAKPVFSRDGTKIYFGGFADGSEEVWVMNADGSGQRQLTSGAGFSAEPDVSPDDRRITFVSDRLNPGNIEDVWVMNADGSGQAKLSSLPSGETAARPSFSPDGRRIAFDYTPSVGDDEIVTISAVDGSGFTFLTTNTGFDHSPDWQPIPVSCGGRQATLVGTEGPDRIVGTSAADVIAGLGGKDKLSGLNGKDRICGGKGKDVLKGGKGNDRLFGQAGKDKLKAGKGRKDKCVGGKGNDKAAGCEKVKSI